MTIDGKSYFSVKSESDGYATQIFFYYNTGKPVGGWLKLFGMFYN